LILNLASGILFMGLITIVNFKYNGFKSKKIKLSLFMVVAIGACTSIGFYGDNYILEICYSLLPLMIILENSFVDIVVYNKWINGVYVPLKTL
jgi:hypothetical protein